MPLTRHVAQTGSSWAAQWPTADNSHFSVWVPRYCTLWNNPTTLIYEEIYNKTGVRMNGLISNKTKTCPADSYFLLQSCLTTNFAICQLLYQVQASQSRLAANVLSMKSSCKPLCHINMEKKNKRYETSLKTQTRKKKNSTDREEALPI